MTTPTYQSYDEAAQAYLARFQAVGATPTATPKAITRSVAENNAENLVEQADAIAEVSAQLTELSRAELTSRSRVRREGVSHHLLAQATAEMQLATELLQMPEVADATPRTATATVRSGSGAALQDAIKSLEQTMATPIAQGVPIPKRRSAASEVASSVEQAKSTLQGAIGTTVSAIVQQVQELGGDLTFDVVVNTQWSDVIQGVGMLNKDIAQKLDDFRQGVGALFARAVSVAAKTLLNVYDKILALLGREAEDKARQQVKDWLEQIKKDGKVELFNTLLDKLYQVDTLKQEQTALITKSTASNEKISETSELVTALADRFTVLAGQMKSLAGVIALARVIKAPQVVAVVVCLRVGLLGALVYSGYDYLGRRQVGFLNLTKGVAEVTQEQLA